MPQNTTLTPLSPNQKAAIGTVFVVILLAAFAFAGFWYGKNHTNDEQNTTTNTTTTTGTQNITQATNDTSITGKISKVLEDAIEVTINANQNTQLVTAKVVKETTFRKIDLRTIKSTGVGNGTPITFKDLKVGGDVIVATTNATSNTIDATRISLVIYP